jgi:drug/metabolite transporter (DMT)-like permease
VRIWVNLWIVYIVWGSTYLAIRYVVETMPAMLSGGVRFCTAGLIFMTYLVVRRGVSSLKIDRRGLIGCAIVGIALLLGGNGLVAVGEDMGTPSGLAALVIATVPLWIVLFRAGTGDRVSRSTVLWVAMGFAGVALLLLPGERPDGTTISGILVLVAAAFSWAAGSFASGRLGLPSDPVVTTAWQTLIGGVSMVVVGLLAGEGSEFDVSAFSTESILGLIYLIVMGSLVAYTAYVWLLQNAPISQVATYAYVNPVVAIALGALFVDEAVTPLVAGAAAVIVASVAGTVRKESSKPEPVVQA